MASKEVKKRLVVLASGVFDLLHIGHVRYLEESKKTGGENAKLVVIVATDATVEKRKGKKPVLPEDQRLELVKSLKVVDEAVLGYEGFDIDKVIDKIKPDIITVGHDQEGVERETKKAIAERGLNIKVVRIGRFGKEELNSSLKIKRKIAELYKH
jgi:FAD synthetase